jgi:hypothetical protein
VLAVASHDVQRAKNSLTKAVAQRQKAIKTAKKKAKTKSQNAAKARKKNRR